MTKLSEKKCQACDAGGDKFTPDQIAEYRKEVPEWELTAEDGEDQLQRVFKFDDFAGALAFTDKVGELAESVGHHPALLTEYGKCTVRWWTHKIGGLHEADFIMAARTDLLYE